MKIIAILKKIKHKLRKYQFNYYKTIIANFKLFPFKQAIHFPLVIYTKTELKLSKSKIILNTTPKFATIKWGRNQDLFVPSGSHSLLLMINGQIFIDGPVRISPGCVFRIFGGKVYLGKFIEFGGNCKLLCNNKLVIGEECRFAFGNIICDTNYHYISNNGTILNCHGEVIIGKSVWIANNCSIVKGAIIPDYAVVSNKSYVNKDLSGALNGALIAGTPAKILKENCKQVRSPKLEQKINNYFNIHKDTETYIISKNDTDNENLTRYFI